MSQRILCLFLFAALLGGCAYSAPRELDFLTSISQEEEIRIGREFRREAKTRLKFVRDLEVNRYVERIGRRILSAMGPQPFEYRFFVVRDPELNAFAVPGGSIYVHTGLIEKVRSTDELASVLGHEISHVKAHHMARMSGPDPMNLLGLLGIFLGGAGAQAAAALGQAVSAASQLSYSRKLEQEADTLGVRFMAAAGFDPNAAVSFLKTLDQERIMNPVDVPPYLLTHPLTQDRLGSVEGVIHSLRLRKPRLEGPDPIKKIQAILRLENNESAAVIAEYKKLTSQHPARAEPLYILAMAYQHRGEWREARENFERARALDSGNASLDRDLGRLYTRTGEYRLAHESLQRAMRKDPKEPLTYLYLGDLFSQESRFREAARAYFRAASLSPLWAEAARRLGAAYSKIDRPGEAHYYLGRYHLLLDEDEMAIDDLQKAAKIFGSTSPQGQMIRDELEAIKRRQ